MKREEEISNESLEYMMTSCIHDEIYDVDVRNAFEEGAKWADKHPDLSSLWHDASEEPIYDGALLGVNYDGVSIYKWCNQEGSWESFAKYCVLKRWAYIDDLMPKD